MAITDKEEGVWDVDQVYNKINEGGIWSYNAVDPFRLFAWGRGNDQNLGLNDTANRSSPTQVGANTNWGGGKDVPYSNWYGGSEASCSVAIKQDGTIWRWSEGKNGSSGANLPNYTWPSSPIQIGTDSTWYQLANSKGTMLAVKSDGTFWSWGKNDTGQMGLNSTGNRSSPCQVGTDTNWDTPFISNTYASFALKTDGTLWGWGYPGRVLGVNNNNPYSSPKQIPGTTWTSGGAISANGSAFMVKTDGTLWTWGHNGRGQLAHNDSIYKSSPTQVGTDTTWKSNYGTGVNCEGAFSLAVKTDGTLWSWGYNSAGQLGLNQSRPDTGYWGKSSPAQVGTDTTWDTCRADKGHVAFATKTDGTAWTWGANQDGKFGLSQSSPTKRSSPVQIPGTDWAVIRPNYFDQVYALKKGT